MFQRFLAQMSTLPSSHESGKPEERKRTTKLLYPPYGKHLERKREKTDRLGRDSPGRRLENGDHHVMERQGTGHQSRTAGAGAVWRAESNQQKPVIM